MVFSNFIFDDFSSTRKISDYFLDQPNHYKNSIRDFSVGQIISFNSIKNDLPIPAVNIDIKERDFFGENGIYTQGIDFFNSKMVERKPWWKKDANYHRRGYKSKIKCSASYFDTQIHESIEVNLKINGNNTRAYPQKSIRIKDDGIIQNHLFKEKSSDWLIFRNSGNDWDRTMFSDVFCSQKMKNLNVLVSKFQPTYLFINNSFWGLYNSRQRVDEKFIANKKSVEVEKILLYEYNGVVKYGDSKAKKQIRKLNDAIKENDLKTIKELIDFDNFIDYIFVETFFHNTDWPNNNVVFYKIDKKSEKFNFIPKDFDYALAYTSEKAYSKNPFLNLRKKQNTLVSELFSFVLLDKELKDKFLKRIAVLIKNDFSKDQLLVDYSSFQSKYERLIDMQINRWRYPRTKQKWVEYTTSNSVFLEKRTKEYQKFLTDL